MFSVTYPDKKYLHGIDTYYAHFKYSSVPFEQTTLIATQSVTVMVVNCTLHTIYLCACTGAAAATKKWSDLINIHDLDCTTKTVVSDQQVSKTVCN